MTLIGLGPQARQQAAAATGTAEAVAAAAADKLQAVNLELAQTKAFMSTRVNNAKLLRTLQVSLPACLEGIGTLALDAYHHVDALAKQGDSQVLRQWVYTHMVAGCSATEQSMQSCLHPLTQP